MSITLHNRPPEARYSQPLLVQLADLFLMELTNWRWVWQRHVLFNGVIAPGFMMVLLGLLVAGGGAETLAYILTGNMVMGLLFGTMNSVESRVEWLRFNGGLDYFATLPAQRFAFVLAMVMSFVLFSLPAMATTLALGALWLQVPLSIHPLLLLVVPCCAIPLAGVGALVGLTCRSRNDGGSLILLLTFLMTALGPVMIPPDRLPDAMLLLGRFSPATYAASALRQAVIGPVTGQMVFDLAVLAATAVVCLWFVGQKLNWRE